MCKWLYLSIKEASSWEEVCELLPIRPFNGTDLTMSLIDWLV